MTTLKLEIKYRGKVINSPDSRPEGIPIRAWRQILKFTNLAMGQYWHKHFLPMHFSVEAKRRYQGNVYAPRSDRHKQRKERQRGLAAKSKNEYLVFTGKLRELTTRGATYRVFPTRVRIHLATPHYVYKRPKPGKPNIHAEVTAVNAAELRTLRQVGRKVLVPAIREYRRTQSLPSGAGNL